MRTVVLMTMLALCSAGSGGKGKGKQQHAEAEQNEPEEDEPQQGEPQEQPMLNQTALEHLQSIPQLAIASQRDIENLLWIQQLVMDTDGKIVGCSWCANCSRWTYMGGTTCFNVDCPSFFGGSSAYHRRKWSQRNRGQNRDRHYHIYYFYKCFIQNASLIDSVCNS